MTRHLPQLVLTMLPLLMSCQKDEPIGDESDADTDADTDADSDADSDADTDADTDADGDAGDDIASATQAAYSDGKTPTADDEIGEPGDRDFFAIEMNEGERVLAFTLAYALDKDGEPDTVLRLWDSAGSEIVENDDMPFRIFETDSAVLFQAETTDTYYFEVLDWTDWADWEGDPAGGSTFDYEFWVLALTADDVEPNDTMADVDKLYDTKTPTLYQNLFNDKYYSDFYGDLDSSGDVDMFRLDVPEGDYLGIMMWPQSFGTMTPAMTLYDQTGNVVARTEDPGYTVDNSVWFVDHALLHRATKGAYYFAIEDLAGNSGPGTFYGGMIALYIPEAASLESESNDVVLAGNVVPLEESTSTAGFYYAAMAGEVGTGSDPADCFHLAAGDAGGDLGDMYVSILLQAYEVGSLLDGRITVYGEDGAEEIGSATTSDVTGSPDAAAVDVQVPSGEQDVYVCIEPESADAYANANQYVVEFTVYGKPSY
jgi:hypothetical protein